MIVVNAELAVVAGADAATKRDTAAIALCTWTGTKVRLVNHRIFTPRPGEPLDLEETLEASLLEYHQRFDLREVRYDPFQFARSALTLQKAGLTLVEVPQVPTTQTKMTNLLFELLRSGNFIAYPDEAIRTAFQRTVVVDNGRGQRLAKEKAAHQIDIVVAIALAAQGVIESLAGRQAIIAQTEASLGPRHLWDPVNGLVRSILPVRHHLPLPSAPGDPSAARPVQTEIIAGPELRINAPADVGEPPVGTHNWPMVQRVGGAHPFRNDPSERCSSCRPVPGAQHEADCPELLARYGISDNDWESL